MPFILQLLGNVLNVVLGNVLNIVIVIAVICLVASNVFVVRQQHVSVIERLGRFSRILLPGLHVKVPVVDSLHMVNLMTQDESMKFDAKTLDNVTIELEVAVQYRVDDSMPSEDGSDMGGIYRSRYTLTNPVDQMRAYLADALRSQIPSRTLDDVFSEKDSIAQSIDDVVSSKMLEYGYILVTTLITAIKLPESVQESMNDIVASKNKLASARNEADAKKVAVVTAAEAKATAMASEGKGIADQRAAIAKGIAASLGTITSSGVSTAEANSLFQFTQWVDMMNSFGHGDNGSKIVVLPSDFRESASMFEQMTVAGNANDGTSCTSDTHHGE